MRLLIALVLVLAPGPAFPGGTEHASHDMHAGYEMADSSHGMLMVRSCSAAEVQVAATPGEYDSVQGRTPLTLTVEAGGQPITPESLIVEHQAVFHMMVLGEGRFSHSPGNHPVHLDGSRWFASVEGHNGGWHDLFLGFVLRGAEPCRFEQMLTVNLEGPPPAAEADFANESSFGPYQAEVHATAEGLMFSVKFNGEPYDFPSIMGAPGHVLEVHYNEFRHLHPTSPEKGVLLVEGPLEQSSVFYLHLGAPTGGDIYFRFSLEEAS